MSQNGFRFSHDKRTLPVTFEEFLATAKKLQETLFLTRCHLDVYVFTAEDPLTYDYTTTTYWSEEIEAGLKHRKQYSFDDLTQEIWDRSFEVQISLHDALDPEPFMVCLSCDKHGDGKRIRFYGQCLDERTHQAVIQEFSRPTLEYQIGDGMTKTSLFNMAMGCRLTGIPWPTWPDSVISNRISSRLR